MPLQRRRSFASRRITEINLDPMTGKELLFDEPRLMMLLNSTKALLNLRLLENLMFERFADRMLADNAIIQQTELPSSIVRRLSAQTTKKLTRLSFRQKCIVASYGLDEFTKDLEKLKHDCEIELEQYKNSLEAINKMAEEHPKNVTLFNRAVVQPLNSTPGRSSGWGKFCHFHKSYLNRLDAQVANMRLENNRLKNDYWRMKKYLAECDDTAQLVELIDWDYVRIRCRQAVRKLQRLEVVCVHVKATAARLRTQLIALKLRLNQEMTKNVRMEKEADNLVSLVSKLKDQVLKNKRAMVAEAAEYREVGYMLTNYKVPTISRYVNTVVQMTWLMRERTEMNRKKRIAAKKLEHHRKLWSRIQLNRTN